VLAEPDDARTVRGEVLRFGCEVSVRASEQKVVADQTSQRIRIAGELSEAQPCFGFRYLPIGMANKN
jgi:hypothetical protein